MWVIPLLAYAILAQRAEVQSPPKRLFFFAWGNGRFWPKAAPKISCFLLVKTSALEKSGH